jgi:hypothetical protein
MAPTDFKVVKNLDGKRWRVAAVHGRAPHRWAWLVNVDKPLDQCRFSLKAWEEIAGAW